MPASPALDEVVVKREEDESSRALGSEEPVTESPRRSGRVRKSAHTERAVSTRRINSEEEMEEKVKIKREDTIFVLSDDSIALRLAPIQEQMNTKFGTDRKAPTDEIQLTPVPRYFLSWFHGGSPQSTLIQPSRRLELLNGVNLFAYPMPSWNPLAPKAPTIPGLAFIETDYTEPIRLFIKKNKGWLYCGDYIFQMSSHLSVNEWKSQPKLVRETWVSEYFGKNWHSERHKPKVQEDLAWYLVRRRQPRPWEAYYPTKEEKEECIRTGEIERVTPVLVRSDFDNGRMFVPVRGLCLHHYDSDYQKLLVEGNLSDEWIEVQQRRADAKTAKKAREVLGQAKTKKNTRTKPIARRKAAPALNAAALARLRVQATWDIDSEEESDEDDEEEAPPTGRARNMKRTRNSTQSDTESESASNERARKRVRKDGAAKQARVKRMAHVEVPVRKLRARAASPVL